MSTVTRQTTSTFHLANDTKEVKQEVTIKEINQDDQEDEISEIVSFNQRHQSVLSITHFNDPLTIQEQFPIPELKDHDVLVSNKAIGLNPIDWKGKKYQFGIYHFPWINGRESSGVVVQTGKLVNQQDFTIGDKVIVSSTSYRDNRTSTFQQFTAIDSRLVWKLPTNFSFEDGATIGVGLVTAGVIFYNSFKFQLTINPPPTSEQESIIIWGGATVVGLYATQIAKINGLKVILVASLKHEEYLRHLGADIIVDRHLPIEEIKQLALSFGPIKYGIDCVSKETSSIVLDILSNFGDINPLFSGIVGIPKLNIPPQVEIREVIIKQFHENIEFGKQFVTVTSHLFTTHQIKPVRYRHYKGGLHIIDDALNDLEAIGAKGEKYVVSI
ncbi:quinone oxidoreductase [Scheffersomyces coipomensis]|uniref:quinone oxidoreductase n=1 Tax=Scheffersomyces coipomensis TaxID=1788519 RepID=UPI00315C8397